LVTSLREQSVLQYETTVEQPQAILARERYDFSWLESKARHLIDSHPRIEYDNWEKEPEINARTALFEELTAKGHLSRVEFDEPADITNERTLRRLLNGWNSSLLDWEKRRRFYEIVEELIIHEAWMDIQAGNLPSDALVITISDYPEMADDKSAHIIGYRALNHKGMARSTHFEQAVNGTWYRITEQISRSNSKDDSSQKFINNSTATRVERGSQNILASSLITNRTAFPDGIVDVQRALDGQAGPNIIFGEIRGDATINLPEYEDLRRVSAEREHQAEHQIKELADFERILDIDYKAGRISYDEKLSKINVKRRDIVNKICLLNPAYAFDARGAAAAEHFEKAALSMAAGDDAGGAGHFASALANADSRAGVVCGGEGSAVGGAEDNANSANILYREAKKERRFWRWIKGICGVSECPSRPEKTEVGPCSVCRECQRIFDDGGSPERVYRTRQFIRWLFGF
jgi:hypothetical protein